MASSHDASVRGGPEIAFESALEPSPRAPFEDLMSLPLFPDQAEAVAPAGKRPIAVIGAGFSGTIAALQLLRRLPVDQPVLLCERSLDFARGVAYSTGDHDHLLNVRAANMSALSDEPLHFQEWLKRRATRSPKPEGLHETEAGLFASRGLYGEYLRSILDFAMRETAGHAQLRLLPDDVLDVLSADHGDYELVCASGQRLAVAGVVLANGNLPPEESEDPHICRNAWSDKAWQKLDPDRPVMIIGTGLTMVDVAVGLRRRGFKGGIVALSRGGLLPTRHKAIGTPWPTPHFTMAEETSLPLLMTRLRDEVFAAAEQGVDWRAVIDSMRPVTAAIWGRLPPAERRRFLRHARRFWDVHRHRMAPPHADLIQAMLDDGTLRVVGGRIKSFESLADGVRVKYAPRRRPGDNTPPAEATLDVQRVIMASGVEHISRTRDALMQRLLDRGLARVDGQGLGLDVTDGLNVVRADSGVCERIWALGPIVRGVFWECVAVPDIRVQAAHLAVSVVARLREDAPRWSFII
jgi:uncharacterized NAD(P)/FAD-binding protein YdhS